MPAELAVESKTWPFALLGAHVRSHCSSLALVVVLYSPFFPHKYAHPILMEKDKKYG